MSLNFDSENLIEGLGTVDRVLALHLANVGLIPDIHMLLQAPLGVFLRAHKAVKLDILGVIKKEN